MEGDLGKRRFKFQQDGVFKLYDARRRAIQKTLQEIMESEENYAIVGATLFGSLSKGSSRYTSDIDLCIFIDYDLLRDKSSASLKVKDLPYKIRERISKAIRRNLSVLRMPSAPHILVAYTGEFFIDGALEILAGGKNDKIYLEYDLCLHDLSRMFHLAVTQGIMPYRRLLLDKLSRMGDKGEKIWQKIIKHTARLEQFDKKRKREEYRYNIHMVELSPSIRYPNTLEDAVRVYGS